jgi:hypothetical protein
MAEVPKIQDTNVNWNNRQSGPAASSAVYIIKDIRRHSQNQYEVLLLVVKSCSGQSFVVYLHFTNDGRNSTAELYLNPGSSGHH